MPDTVNPYVPGQPVDTPERFFGRRDVLTSIREHLLKGRRIFAISGAPRSGRSSLLRQLPYHLPEEFVSVRVDLAETESGLKTDTERLDRLLWRVGNAIAQRVSPMGGLGLDAVWTDFEANPDFLVDQFWPRVHNLLDNRCLVLSLDDLDCLAEARGGLKGAHKEPPLRGSAQEDLLDLLVATLETWRDRDEDLALILTVSATSQEALMRRYPHLFGGALTYELGPLSGEEATRLITRPVDGVLTYDFGVARRVVEITSGQPFYLQLLCFEVFNRCAAAGWVNQHDVDLVVEDLVGREIADFRQLWDESSPQEQAVLASLVSLRGARGVATAQEVRTILVKAGARAGWQQVGAALASLTERGILERLGALSYRFQVALLRDWLGKRLDLQEVVRNTRWEIAKPARAAGEQQVLKLSTRQHGRKPASQPRQTAAEHPEEEQEKPRLAGRRWQWIGAAAVVGLVLVVVVGAKMLRDSPSRPTAAVNSSPSPPAYLALTQGALGSAMPTPGLTRTAQPAAVSRPTTSPTPLPTETPSPTPPLVVARPMPSIAYQSRGSKEPQWSVYVMNSDGSNRTLVAEGQAGFLSAPSWSPDGARIAYVSERDGNPDIWVMGSDGSDPVNLTQNKAKEHSPAWSPDGKWIAFASVRDSLYWELYLMQPDGTAVQRLTWWEDASDLSPTWSPDGTRLAFASRRDGNWEIYTMDRDGGNLTRLTDHLADDTNPAWSPDGSRIAFVSTRDGYPELYMMPVVGGEAVNVSHEPFSSEHGPTWSPDGGRLAFYSDRDGEWDIYVMATDGSDLVKLTGDSSDDQVPAWRP